LQLNYQGDTFGEKEKANCSWSALQIPSQVTVAMYTPVKNAN